MAARIRKHHQDCNKRFYVYHVKDGDKVVYVGKGSGRRNYVQQRHFKLPVFIVEWFSSENAAYAREVEMIASLAPCFNKHPGGNGSRTIAKPNFEDAWEKRFFKIGSKRYAAMLGIVFGSKTLGKSKVDALRQVAYG